GKTVPSNVFRYKSLSANKAETLASAPDGAPLALSVPDGKGKVIMAGVPLGLGIDERPVPLLALLLQRLAAGQMPFHVSGDVEWVLNKLDDGGWLVALLNNSGVIKPQHGMLPTDYREAKKVRIDLPFIPKDVFEWITGKHMIWSEGGNRAAISVTIPAGAV